MTSFRTRGLLNLLCVFALSLAYFSILPGQAAAQVAEVAQPGKTLAVSPDKPGPKLNISSIECVPGGVRVHFVLVHNTFTDAQLAAASLTFQYQVNGGATQTAIVPGPFTKSPGQTAHFDITLPGFTGTLAVTGGSLSVAGQTIPLHNTLTQTVNCGPPIPPPTGTLKICKVLAPGTTAPAGTLFTFSVTGVGVVSVAPGTCTLATVNVGNVVVQETGPAGFQVSAITVLAGACTPLNVAAGNATCQIVANQVTEVQFTNIVVPPIGTLKICKDLAPGATVPQGTLFTFTVPGVGTVSVLPGTCTLVNLPAGTVTITETGPTGYRVTAITVLAGSCTVNVAGRSATCQIVANQVTEVRFTNIPERAFIQICKETVGVTLPATFTFTSPAFPNQSITVTAGATQPVCGPLTEVQAGTITITEPAVGDTQLTNVRTVGPGTCTLNVATRTATCTIPAGGPAQQTVIIFRNERPPQPGFIQICKETEGGLTGTFTFTSPAFTPAQTINVTAGATQPVCGPLTRVTSGTIAITEAAVAGVTLAGVRVAAGAGTCTLSGLTATCAIPAGNEAQQTVIVFRNRRTT